MQEQGPIVVQIEGDTPKRPRRGWFFFFVCLFLLMGALLVWWSTLVSPPVDFPVQKIIMIPEGTTLRGIAAILKNERVIQTEGALIALIKYKGAESRLASGEYIFSSPIDLYGVAERLSTGLHGITRIRVTIPEGTSVMGIGRILQTSFSGFNAERFVSTERQHEGYLFPDTYFFYSTATSGPITEALRENFLIKTKLFSDEARELGKDWNEIITMASLVEEEAITPEDRRIVSGILWKRIKEGMRLQVDAPFAYIIGKNSAGLTIDDLKFDSPYNTYRYDGLPPGPITNPGLDSIDAALHPTPTTYFFYLSDANGEMHYARTFDEHKLNKAKYLR